MNPGVGGSTGTAASTGTLATAASTTAASGGGGGAGATTGAGGAADEHATTNNTHHGRITRLYDVTVRVVVGLLMVSACGRLQFDRIEETSVTADAAADSAIASLCGDGLCNAGELCPTCADCETQLDVCGNGSCSATEDSTSCYADCGPSPWTWVAEETELVSRINAARTAGTNCGTGTITSPALTPVTSLMDGAHEWVWEVVYQQLPIAQVSCNGRDLFERIYEAGGANAVAAWHNDLQPTPQTAFMALMSSATICESLMDPAYTRMGVGAAYIDGRVMHLYILD